MEKSGETICRSYGSGQYVTTTCDTPTYTSYEEVCAEIPVPINVMYEREQLDKYVKLASDAEKAAGEALEICYEKVFKMTATQAYDYHKL